MYDEYTMTILESCDDLTREELENLLEAGYSIEEAVEELCTEGEWQWSLF